VARRIGSTSRFGVEYDTIADTVSFGIAPAMLAFHAGAFTDLGWTGWVMAFLYTVCAALRLARFNVSPGRYRGRFEGLPSPAAAGMVLATVWFDSFLAESGFTLHLPASLPALGLALLGLLMVSPVPYRNFKELRFRASYANVVLATLALGLVLSKPSVTFFLVGLGYVASGPLELVWRWRTGTRLEEIVHPEAHPPPAGADSTRETPP
jgi:CDP-diacylglycerol--serine O-phosphatidyltransferase